MLTQQTLWQSQYSTIVACADAQALPVRDESVDLVVTSPPYNCGIPYDVHDDAMPHDAYLEMLCEVWGECLRVMKPGARICLVVPVGTGRTPYRPLGAEITLLIQSIFQLKGVIVWNKATSSNRTTWGSWRLPTNPSLRDCAELIIIGKNPGIFNVPDEVLEFDEHGRRYSPWLTAENFPGLTQNLWTIKPETSLKVGHPVPFPSELVERLLRLYGFVGCTVLDPFGGSGTVAIAAKRLGCHAVSLDISEGYCRMASKRVQEMC